VAVYVNLAYFRLTSPAAAGKTLILLLPAKRIIVSCIRCISGADPGIWLRENMASAKCEPAMEI